MGVSVKVDVDLSRIQKKLSSENMKKARYAVANQMIADMNQFVPADQYDLRAMVAMKMDGSSILYTAPYAKAQFYGTNGKAVFSNYTTPGTGKRWDLKAKGLFMSDWVKAFERGLKL